MQINKLTNGYILCQVVISVMTKRLIRIRRKTMARSDIIAMMVREVLPEEITVKQKIE